MRRKGPGLVPSLTFAALGCLSAPAPALPPLRVPAATRSLPGSGLRGKLEGPCASAAVAVLAPAGREGPSRSARAAPDGSFVIAWPEDAAAALELRWGCDADGDGWVRPPGEPLGKLALGAARAWPTLSLALPPQPGSALR
jgi:hypothetical protein